MAVPTVEHQHNTVLPHLVGVRAVLVPEVWQAQLAELFPQKLYTSFQINYHLGYLFPSPLDYLFMQNIV